MQAIVSVNKQLIRVALTIAALHSLNFFADGGVRVMAIVHVRFLDADNVANGAPTGAEFGRSQILVKAASDTATHGSN